jgi:hypothetical protein
MAGTSPAMTVMEHLFRFIALVMGEARQAAFLITFHDGSLKPLIC